MDGALLLLITFTTNYGDDNLFQRAQLPAYEQVGMALHLAALAALAGAAQLATRLRHRAGNRAAEEREQATHRSRIQNGCLVAQFRLLLAVTSRNRLQLNEALAVLLEELMPITQASSGQQAVRCLPTLTVSGRCERSHSECPPVALADRSRRPQPLVPVMPVRLRFTP